MTRTRRRSDSFGLLAGVVDPSALADGTATAAVAPDSGLRGRADYQFRRHSELNG
jgi:hypothetical protein